MTLYELLRRLVQVAPVMGETEKEDAYALIDRLQKVNAFSTVAAGTVAQGHECYFDPANHQCIYCHRGQYE